MPENNFYVYILRRPDKVDPFDKNKGQPFYVGKGRNGRAKEHRTEAERLLHKSGRKIIKIVVIHKLWKQGFDFEEEIYIENLTEEKALNIECNLIKKYGRIDKKTGILTNMTDGGDGVVGLIMSESAKELLRQHANNRTPEQRKKCGKPGKVISIEQRQKISMAGKGKTRWWKGIPLSSETKKKISEKLKGRKFSEEHRRKISEGNSGEKNGMYGKHHSEEMKKIISEKSRNISPETRKKMSESQKSRPPRDREIYKKLSETLKGKPRSNEIRKKVSEGLKRYFAQKRGENVE